MGLDRPVGPAAGAVEMGGTRSGAGPAAIVFVLDVGKSYTP